MCSVVRGMYVQKPNEWCIEGFKRDGRRAFDFFFGKYYNQLVTARPLAHYCKALLLLPNIGSTVTSSFTDSLLPSMFSVTYICSATYIFTAVYFYVQLCIAAYNCFDSCLKFFMT